MRKRLPTGMIFLLILIGTTLSAAAQETGEPHDENSAEPTPGPGTGETAFPLWKAGVFFLVLILFAAGMGYYLGGPGKR